jgi:hypothetical protein
MRNSTWKPPASATRQACFRAMALRTRLLTVNRELSLAREFIAPTARDLDARTDGGERLSVNADRQQALVVKRARGIDRPGQRGCARNMESCAASFRQIASSAKNVTNNIANAGHGGQIEEMIRGFAPQRIRAGQRNAGQARDHATKRSSGWRNRPALGAMAAARFVD